MQGLLVGTALGVVTLGAVMATSLEIVPPPEKDLLMVAVPERNEPEPVFIHALQACEESDVPDTPARAFRSTDGTIRMVASHHRNRVLLGRSLDRLEPDCSVVFEGKHSDEPADFSDRSWLTSFYTEDGSTVHALVHNEFLAHRREGLCPSGKYLDCWYNTVTYAVSTDGGQHFRAPEPPNNLVAALPYRYDPGYGKRTGLFNPTNIIRQGEHFYFMSYAAQHGEQKRGPCLIRTDTLSDPGSWRAWDGRDYTIRFAHPYAETIENTSHHVCAPVGEGNLPWLVTSLTKHRKTGIYLATMAGSRTREGSTETGIWASNSTDLITWSPPYLVWQADLLSKHRCSSGPTVFYPSLIDPDSPTRNFEDTDDEAFIYMTRFNLDPARCRAGWDRDLVRLPVKIFVTEKEPAAPGGS